MSKGMLISMNRQHSLLSFNFWKNKPETSHKWTEYYPLFVCWEVIALQVLKNSNSQLAIHKNYISDINFLVSTISRK